MLNLEVTRSDNFVVAEEKNMAAMERAVASSIILNDLPDVLEKERRKGFDTNPDNYTLILRNRGQESRRQLKTLPGAIPYIRLGRPRQPVSFTFIQKGAQNWQPVLQALNDAMMMVEKRYSRIRDTGQYGRNLMFLMKSGTVTTITRRFLPTDLKDLQEGDTVGIIPQVSYASWVEYYHGASKARWGTRYKGRERPKRIKGGGIVRPVALAIARKYPNIAVRYVYNNEHYGVGPSGWYYTPMILLAPKGTFANAFVPIGRKKRHD